MKSRFDEIVGLRIYLAAWVAIGHGLQTAGYVIPTNPLMRFLLAGGASVDVFIIISGFVITHLIETAREPYGKYIVRRGFRLYPVYLISCVFGFLIADSWSHLSTISPWSNVEGWGAYSKNVVDSAQQLHINPFGHIAAHALMLHGVVPNEILPMAARTILPAAWSISLEWQFYLVAPLVLFGLRSRGGIFWTALLGAMFYVATSKGYLGQHDFRSFIGSSIPFFAVGICSRLAFGWVSKLECNPLTVATASCAVIIMLGKEVLPLFIWAVFYSYLVWQRDDPISRLFRLLTKARPLLILGEASYSLYLIHRPIQVVLAVLTISTIGSTQHGMLIMQMVAVVIAIIVSIGLYFCVEKPFIRLGKHLTRSRAGAGVTDAVRVPV